METGSGSDPDVNMDKPARHDVTAGMAKRPRIRIAPPPPQFRTASPDPPMLDSEISVSIYYQQLEQVNLLKDMPYCSLSTPPPSSQAPHREEMCAINQQDDQPSTSTGITNPVSVAAIPLLNQQADLVEELLQPLKPPNKTTASSNCFSDIQQKIRKVSNENKIAEDQRKKMLEITERTKFILKQADAANKTNKPHKRQTYRPRCGTKETKTPVQISILETEFHTNRDPKPSLLFQIAAATGLSLKDVKKWFYQERKKHGPITTPSKSRNDISNSRVDTAEANNEDNVPPQQAEKACTDTAHSSNPAHAHQKNDQKAARKNAHAPRFIKRIQDRTDDNLIIMEDMRLVEESSVDVVKNILETVWEVKANRIYRLVTMTEKKHVLSVEAKRLDHIAYAINPFSIEQDMAVDIWFDQYVDKLCSDSAEEREKLELKQYLSHVILPWLRPFVYSRIVKQDGRNLCLLVAIDDFCRISHDKSARTFKWEVPGLLQDDCICIELRNK